MSRLNANFFKNKYKEISGEKSLLNPDMNEAMFLVLAGAVCHKNGILVQTQGLRDLRIHTLIIQPSRTGKGVSLKVLEQALRFCGVTYVDEIQFTDAGLVGEIDTSIAQKNKKHGYTESDPEYQNPVSVGDLGTYDVVSFSEGKQMIKISGYAEDKLEILQSIMDTPGKLRKKLANSVEIRYISNSTVIGTTYFLDDFEQIFLEQGIFQRMLVMVRKFTAADRRKLNKAILNSPAIDIVRWEDDLKNFCSDLTTRVNSIPKNSMITVDPKAVSLIDKKIDGWTDSIEDDFKGSELEIMLGYTTAAINLFYKIGGIAAVLNGRTVIKTPDVNFAQKYVKLYLKSIQNEVLTKVSVIDDRVIAAFLSRYIAKNETRNTKQEPVDGPSIDEIKIAVKAKFHDLTDARIFKVIRDMIGAQEIEYLNNKKDKLVRIEK